MIARARPAGGPKYQYRIIPLLNYLTSEIGEPTMSSSSKKGRPDACGILANLWQLIQSVLDDSEPDLEALGLSPKAFFLLAAVEEHPFPAELARRMHLPPPTVTYMVKQLEEKRLSGAAGRTRLTCGSSGSSRPSPEGRHSNGGG